MNLQQVIDFLIAFTNDHEINVTISKDEIKINLDEFNADVVPLEVFVMFVEKKVVFYICENNLIIKL